MNAAARKIEMLQSLQVIVAGGMLAVIVVTVAGLVARGMAYGL